MSPRAYCFIAAAIVSSWVAFAPVGWTDETSAAAFESFPEASVFLAGKGYPPESHTVLLTWNEVARNTTGEMVTGYRVQRSDGSQPFDIYADCAGGILTSAQLHELGVPAKNWNITPLEKAAEAPERQAAPKRRATSSSSSAPQPAALLKGLRPLTAVSLPRIDLLKVADEDRETLAIVSKGPRRIGVVRDLPAPVEIAGDGTSHGVWQTLSDGSALWSLTFRWDNAKGQRLRFRTLALPNGAHIVIYNTRNPAEAYGPYTEIPERDADFWTPTCFSDQVAIECWVPRARDIASVRLGIDRAVYVYADFGVLPWKGAAGNCNQDVSCYPEWGTTALGVGAIGAIGDAGFLWCTGTLVVDTDPLTDVPYFLTANHCVGQQSTASSLEVYWLYQTDHCGGSVPNPLNVPRTSGGADYLAGTPNETGTDFAFLRLRQAPPQGITFVGWTSLPQPVGTSVTAIHHPNGDYKRISFGTTINDPGDYYYMAGERFHQVRWWGGTTEPGSSGSPLMTPGQQIVGQLYGGGASCSAPSSPDYFGRFDVSFPVIESWLSPVYNPKDIDHSGRVDSVDVQLVINAALQIAIPDGYNADIDHSGTVDAVDIQLVINAALGL